MNESRSVPQYAQAAKQDDAPDRDGDGAALVVVTLDLLHLLPQAHKVAAKHLLGVWRQPRRAFTVRIPGSSGPREIDGVKDSLLFAVRDVSFHLVDIDFAHSLTVFVRILVRPVHVDVHDVPCDHLPGGVLDGEEWHASGWQYLIPLLVVLVFHDEYHVEPG